MHPIISQSAHLDFTAVAVPPPPPKRTLYFAYGSNLWLHQMAERCPSSPLVGIGRLDGWKFIIHERGSAKITIAPEAHVYGLVYELSPADEETLDINEVVPEHNEKKYLNMTFWHGLGGIPDLDKPGEELEALVYIDPRTKEGEARVEYVLRMGMGIEDAKMKGIPGGYFDEFLRPWIPVKTKEVLEAYAKPKVLVNPNMKELPNRTA